MRFIATIVVFGAALLVYRAAAGWYVEWAVREVESATWESELQVEPAYDHEPLELGEFETSAVDP